MNFILFSFLITLNVFRCCWNLFVKFFFVRTHTRVRGQFGHLAILSMREFWQRKCYIAVLHILLLNLGPGFWGKHPPTPTRVLHNVSELGFSQSSCCDIHIKLQILSSFVIWIKIFSLFWKQQNTKKHNKNIRTSELSLSKYLMYIKLSKVG